MAGETFFSHTPTHPLLPTARLLKFTMPKRRNRYIKKVREKFKSQKVLKAAQELQKEAQAQGAWNTKLQTKYENIDRKATEILFSSEKQCLPKFTTLRTWSATLRDTGLTLRYLLRYTKYYNRFNITQYFEQFSHNFKPTLSSPKRAGPYQPPKH